MAPPGGDFPARRTISTHVQALVEMGARIVDGPSLPMSESADIIPFPGNPR